MRKFEKTWMNCPILELPGFECNRIGRDLSGFPPLPQLQHAARGAWDYHRANWREFQPSLFRGLINDPDAEITADQEWILSDMGWWDQRADMAEAAGCNSVAEFAARLERSYRLAAVHRIRTAVTQAYRSAAAAADRN